MLARAVLGRESDTSAPYVVPEECAARSVWVALVRARLEPRLRSHPVLDTLSVRITRIDGAIHDTYVGELATPAGAALGGARSVSGGSCDEVLDALSFIGALGLVRAAAGRRELSAASGASPAASEEPTRPALTLQSETAASSQRLGNHFDVDAGRAVSNRDVAALRLGAVGFALLQPGLSPARSLALGVALRFDWSTPGWQPSLLLGAYSSLPEEQSVPGGRIRFEHWSSHVVACPWRFPATGRFGFRPCVELDVGRSSGEGLGVVGATRRSAPWLTGGVQVLAELALGEHLALGASAAAVIPFWRAHFYLLPDGVGFDTPALGFRAGSYANLLF
jgi:hypothetical protein